MTRRTFSLLLLLATAAATAGCDRGANASTPDSAEAVDSAVSREVALDRFRARLDSTDHLGGGEGSREALVRAFVRGLETRDTVLLRGLVVTQAEFAWIYYPTNPQSLPPYDLAPGLMWFMLESRSRQGIGAALEVRGGARLGYVGHRCDEVVSREGDNTLYGPCLVRRLQAPGDTVEERLFGPIIERGGRFKFVSYANRL